MNKEKKPPISINEMKNGGQPPAQPGKLTYMENQNPGGGEGNLPPRPSRGKMNYTQLLIAVGLSVLAFLVISNFTLASKGDALALLDNQMLLESKQAALGDSVTGLQGNLSSESQRIENLISTQATYDSQLSGLSNTLSSLGSKITGAESSIVSLRTDVDTLGEEIVTLRTEIEEGLGVSFDYYLEGNILHVRPSRSGNYTFRVTYINYDEYGYVLDEYVEYTRNHYLEAGEWRSGSLLFTIPLGSNVYVEALFGTSNVEEESPGW